jgi:hypothetical protein
MVFPEVLFKSVVINVILLLSALTSPIADMAFFVPVAAMNEQLVVAVESLSTEAAFRMAFESGLIYCAWIVVAEFLMAAKFGGGEEVVFVSKDLFVASTEIAVEY